MHKGFIANTLGVRRVGLTEAVAFASARCLRRYNQGPLTILDPAAGPKAASCVRYWIDKDSYTGLWV